MTRTIGQHNNNRGLTLIHGAAWVWAEGDEASGDVHSVRRMLNMDIDEAMGAPLWFYTL